MHCTLKLVRCQFTGFIFEIMQEQNSKTKIISKKTDSSYDRRRTTQNFLLLWLDSDRSTSDPECQARLEQLYTVVDDINLFTDLDACVAFLGDVRMEKAYVIVSTSLAKNLVSTIHTMKQLHAIFILDVDLNCEEEWVRAWSKIKGVYNRIEPICEALRQAMAQNSREYIPISFPRVDASENDADLNLGQLEPSFMYTQLFKDTLLSMEHSEDELEQMVSYCQVRYGSNQRTRELIDEFRRDYCTGKVIWWYTRDTFIFDMVNRALRILEADIIVNMGFYIHDLHRRIEHLHACQLTEYGGGSFALYRGQGLSITDFERLKSNQGGLMSFNGFLSTSDDQEVSLVFAESMSVEKDRIGILFEMVIDPNTAATPFAKIKEESYFPGEDETLFTMHAVFRTVHINYLNETGY